MKIFIPQSHERHAPSQDFSDGLPPFEHMERPERVAAIRAGLERAGYDDVVAVRDRAIQAVYALHDGDYVDFLLALSREIEPGREYIPPVFHDDLTQAPIWFRGGHYCKEIGTPVGAESVDAALVSAAAAMAAAEHTLDTGNDALALCRPPGHHAGRRRYGGYCFFNNAYLAAQAIMGRKRATLVFDFDYHIGDGSLEFASAGAPYFSLHADPRSNYPYLSTAAADSGPHVHLRAFAQGADVTQYSADFRKLAAVAHAQQPDVVVLSVGLDTLSLDYIQDEQTRIMPGDFVRIGQDAADFPCPVVSIFEGGYDLSYLEDCAAHYFTGFRKGRAAVSAASG